MHYTESHEWVKVTNSTATIGVSQFAQSELGDIVYVELPEVGAKVELGQEVVVLESTKAAADVYSPISGEVVEVNQNLKDHSELINESPEDTGWLLKLKIEDPTQLEKLMDQSGYQDFLKRGK